MALDINDDEELESPLPADASLGQVQDKVDDLSEGQQAAPMSLSGVAAQIAAMQPAPQLAAPAVSSAKSIMDKLNALKGNPTPNATPADPSAQTPSMSDTLAKLLGSQGTDLEDAKQNRNQLQLLAMLNRAGEQVGAGFTPLADHSKDGASLPTLLQNASQKITDVKAKADQALENLKTKDLAEKVKSEQSKNDPDSPISEAARIFYEKTAKQKAPEDLTAADLEKLDPSLSRIFLAEQHSEDRKLQDKANQERRLDEKSIKYSQMMGKDLDPTIRAAGELGKNKARVDAAQRVLGLYDATGGNPNNINMRELATSVAGLLSTGSQAAVGQINELVPHTMAGNGAAIEQWITNNPTGTGQQKFAEMYKHIAERERDIAKNQITNAQFEKAYTTHSALKQIDPASFYGNLSGRTGLEPEDIKKIESIKGTNARYEALQKAISAQQNPTSSNLTTNYSQDVIAYAAKHNITPEQANQIKLQRLGSK